MWHYVLNKLAFISPEYLYAKETDIAGIGIWALSYYGNGRELWDGIKDIANISSVIEYDLTKESIRFSPNPCVDELIIYIENNKFSKFDYYISDIGGKVLITDKFDSKSGAGLENLIINVENLYSGMYILTLILNSERDSKIYSSEFIIAR